MHVFEHRDVVISDCDVLLVVHQKAIIDSGVTHIVAQACDDKGEVFNVVKLGHEEGVHHEV